MKHPWKFFGQTAVILTSAVLAWVVLAPICCGSSVATLVAPAAVVADSADIAVNDPLTTLVANGASAILSLRFRIGHGRRIINVYVHSTFVP